MTGGTCGILNRLGNEDNFQNTSSDLEPPVQELSNLQSLNLNLNSYNLNLNAPVQKRSVRPLLSNAYNLLIDTGAGLSIFKAQIRERFKERFPENVIIQKNNKTFNE